MVVVDPYSYVADKLAESASRTLGDLGYPVTLVEVRKLIEEPPVESLGDLSIPLFQVAKRYSMNPAELASKLASKLEGLGLSEILASRVEARGGYLNVFVDVAKLAAVTAETLKALGEDYGRVLVDNPERVVVEHTSANPVHPLHIGHARNAVLGDTLSRLLEWRGHRVTRRFYINDMGRQVAVLVYGYRELGEPKPVGKPDHFMGLIYAMTHTIVEIDEVKRELESALKLGAEERARRLRDKLDGLVAAAAELRERDKALFDRLLERLKGRDHEAEISNIMASYERGDDPKLVKTVRKVVGLVVEGFKETLARVGISFDYWDWESDLAWSGIVGKVLEEARRSPYFTIHKGAEALDFTSIQADPELRERLGLPRSFDIPPLILRRSDGTTLYATRDVAYSIVKFSDADRVVNVIMSEQKLEQLQVRLALYALGYRREAERLIHYSYEIVKLPGVRMSGRRGRYVTFDKVIDEAVARALVEVKKRNPDMPEDEAYKLAERIGVSALRYTLVSVNASKPLVFKWEDVLNFERNSGPYIQYSYARAHNILRKYGKPIEYENVDYSAAGETPLRRRLVKLIAKFPYVATKAADELRPEYLVDYAGKLADAFNAFYDTDPVLAEPDPGKRRLKLVIVRGVQVVLGNVLRLLGMSAPERM